MDKVVVKYSSHAEAEAADLEYYAKLSYDRKLEIFFNLIIPENRNDAVVERCIRIYPITEQE